jgi:hypothetical protein
VWCHLSGSEKLKLRGTQASLGKKQDPISKITRAKSAGGVVQAVEGLPSKHKALHLNPSTAKGNNDNKKAV